MSCQKKKYAFGITALFILLYTGAALYYSEGITHYWVDESPGPTYVPHTRTPAEVAGMIMFLAALEVGGAWLIYNLNWDAD